MILRRPHHARHRALPLLATFALAGWGCAQPDPGSTSAAAAEAAAQDIAPALKERCERSVKHVAALVRGGPGGGSISPQEAAIIDATTALSVASCEREGLSPAQEACLLEITSAVKLADAAKCPAIAEEKPSWLVLPPTEAEREALLRAYEASVDDGAREVGHGPPRNNDDAAAEAPAAASDHGDHVADGDKDE